MTEELRRIIMNDNHETKKIDDLEKTLEPLSMMEYRFSMNIEEATFHEGADELTRRREEEDSQRVFIDFFNIDND